MRQFGRNRTYALRPAHWLRKTSTGPLFKSHTAGWRSVCHGMETPEHWGFEPEEQDIHAGSERSQGSCAGNIGIGSIRDAVRWKVACGKGKVNLPLSPWEHTLKRNVDDSGKEIFCSWALDFCLHELAPRNRRPPPRYSWTLHLLEIPQGGGYYPCSCHLWKPAPEDWSACGRRQSALGDIIINIPVSHVKL